MHPAIPTSRPGTLARLLPADVACVDTTAERAYVDLFPAELAVAAAYPPARRAEFATARGCAHDALVAAGLASAAIVPGPAGDPVWPAGAVGSLTHCVGYRAAAVGLARSYAAVGIDAEPHAPVPANVLCAVARPDEVAALAALPRDGTAWDRVLFSAKESAYKSWFPRFRGPVEPTDIVVTVRPGGEFDARIRGTAVSGRWAVTPDLVQTAVAVPAPHPPG